MLNAYDKTFEVEYSTGAGRKKQQIGADTKPSKMEALERLTDPSLMMVPPEDIEVFSIKEVAETNGSSIPGL